MRQFEKAVMLQTLDGMWREHLAAMDYLRQGIHLRGYAQKNPKQEYKREAFELFVDLLARINYQVISSLHKFEIRTEQEAAALEAQRNAQRQQSANFKMKFEHAEVDTLGDSEEVAEPVSNVVPFMRDERKVGRNENCPCGSGKKYKHCHGTLS